MKANIIEPCGDTIEGVTSPLGNVVCLPKRPSLFPVWGHQGSLGLGLGTRVCLMQSRSPTVQRTRNSAATAHVKRADPNMSSGVCRRPGMVANLQANQIKPHGNLERLFCGGEESSLCCGGASTFVLPMVCGRFCFCRRPPELETTWFEASSPGHMVQPSTDSLTVAIRRWSGAPPWRWCVVGCSGGRSLACRVAPLRLAACIREESC